MRYFIGIFVLAIIMVVSIFGIRGEKSRRQPMYIFPDMDWQARYKPQAENDFFQNRMDDRPVVPGTRERGYEWDVKGVFTPEYEYEVAKNPPLYTGKDAQGNWYRGFPVPVDMEFIRMGRDKYEIFCTVCHGKTGDGNGITKQYGMATTVSYNSDRLRDMAEGEIFNTITNGKNTMYPYGDKLTPKERWAVIAYMRALQTAANAKVEDVPETVRKDLEL